MRFTAKPCFWMIGCAASVWIALIGLHAAQPTPGANQTQTSGTTTDASATTIDRAVIDRYCVSCHNARLKTGGLALDGVDLAQVSVHAQVLEKVVGKLRSGQMPPANRPRPDKPVLDRFLASLETALDRVADATPNPGRLTVHRLNRVEYLNAIRDLLDLDLDPALVPPDNLGVGFDNNADVLSITPALMSRYLSTATKTVRVALGDRAIRPGVTEYKARVYSVQDARTNEDLPFGTFGGLAVRHVFPLDAEYVFKIRMQRNGIGSTIRGIDDESEIEVNLDYQVVKRFMIGGQHKGFDAAFQTAAADDDIEGRDRHQYRLTADNIMEFRLPIKAGRRLVSVAFVDRDPKIPERVPMRPQSLRQVRHYDDAGDPGIDTIQILGPYSSKVTTDTPSRRRIFVCRPTSPQRADSCARTILGTLARRAYRRPVTDAEVAKLMGLYKVGQQDDGFDGGIGLALETILSSPMFLFRIERDPAGVAPGAMYRVSDAELASRLSFALWKSIPDDELLHIAAQGRIWDPKVRAEQVRRMLADPKSRRWVADFMAQWLGIRRLEGHVPDPSLFPGFDEGLRDAMETETRLFVESQVKDDRSVLDLLRADYTFLNEQLARYYGIRNVYGGHFRRVSVTDPVRQGMLGHGSILTATSYADRTSVVLRGKWVLETLLGAPPPLPPPDVPALEINKPGATPKALRQRMEQHRKNPACAGCHAPMDPLGFALENFDATGRWRDTDGGAAIDAVSRLPDGQTIDGPAGFRAHLLDRRDEYVHTLTTRLMEYFLGRRVEYFDAPAVRKVMRKAAPDYQWSSLILGIVESVPFQMRNTARAEDGVAARVAAAR